MNNHSYLVFRCRSFFHYVRIVITFVNVNSCKHRCWNVSCTRWRIWLGKIFDGIPTGETRWLCILFGTKIPLPSAPLASRKRNVGSAVYSELFNKRVVGTFFIRVGGTFFHLCRWKCMQVGKLSQKEKGCAAY